MASIRERYGGRHARVGAIGFETGALQKARAGTAEIVEFKGTVC
ncbi:MAG: hypothetical protein ABSH24_07940 [Bryobacteraceae bacterium]